MIFKTKTGTQCISREQVWSAWKHVRTGGKGMGIDQVSVDAINANPRKYLYPLWNRLSSGSYFPPAVKETAIPKGKHGKRYLGIPTICDRVAQQVIRTELEAILEPKFYPSSFGSRPNRSAHQAVAQCAANCWERWYALSVDIKGFFDNLDHAILMKILRKYTDKSHILLYCERWLSAPIRCMDGRFRSPQGKSTPQGGVISPVIVRRVSTKNRPRYRSRSTFWDLHLNPGFVSAMMVNVSGVSLPGSVAKVKARSMKVFVAQVYVV